ncbi:MAG: hypothetical protein RIR01_2273 [Bacteroidota bacterium]|jgi:ribosomal protein L37AE/L43A
MISKTKTEEYLRAVELPENTKSYTRIPHGAIIDQMRASIEKENLEVEYELYKGSSLGQEALGFIHIKSTLDSEMGMTFNWTNSYNKKLKFGCSVGAFIYDLNVPFIYADNTITWSRKHTGTANIETKIVVEEMIAHSEEHFRNIIKMKKAFTAIELSDEDMAGVLGEMFFAKDYFGPEQANLVKAEIQKPKYNYTHKGTLWHLHQMLMVSVVDSDPTKWYSQQIKINTYLILKYNIDVNNQLLDEPKNKYIIGIDPAIEGADVTITETSYFTEERIAVIKDESFNIKQDLTPVKEHEPEFTEELEDEFVEEVDDDNFEPFEEAKEDKNEVIEEEEEIFEDDLSCPECGSKDVIVTLHGTVDCNYCEASTNVSELDVTTESTAFVTTTQITKELHTEEIFELEDDDDLNDTFLNEDTSEKLFELEESNEPEVLNPLAKYRELVTDFYNPEDLESVEDKSQEGYIVFYISTGEIMVA